MSGLLTTLFLGAVVGSIYALAAFGLVLTYRASGVLNFAQGAVGMIFAFAFYQLTQGGRVGLVVADYHQSWSLPTGAALVVVVFVLAPAFGWCLNAVLFRRLRDAGEVVKIVVTIGLLVTLQGLAGVMWGASTTLTPTPIFSQRVFSVGGFRASAEQLASIGLALALAGALVVFLRYSSLGVRMRAVVDRPDVAELSGVDTARVSSMSWAVGTGFAALAGILLVPFFGSLDPTTLILFVIIATAAAVVGRLESFGMTLAGGFVIAVAQLMVGRYASTDVSRQLRPAIPFLVLFVVLFGSRWKRRPTDRWTSAALPAPVSRLPVRVRVTAGLLGAVMLVAAPFLLGTGWQVPLARVPAMALVFLSLVVLTGFGGQVSLCQAALAGFGGYTAAHLATGFGLPFAAAVVLGGLAVVPLGVILALRASNLSPLFLAFATLAFGSVMDEVAFRSRSFGGGLAGIAFPRPSMLEGHRAYYLATLAVFAVFALAVRNLHRSRTGLALAAMRDTELGLGSVGIDVARLKLTVFSMSAVMAGTAGALLAAADGAASPFTFLPIFSLVWLALAVIGGIGTWSGALIAGVLIEGLPALVAEPAVSDSALARALAGGRLADLLPVFFGLGAIGLARNPQGIAEQMRSVVVRLAGRGVPAPVLPVVEPVGPREPDAALVVLPSARMVHRADCLLAVGKPGAVPAVGTGPPLRGCPVCEP